MRNSIFAFIFSAIFVVSCASTGPAVDYDSRDFDGDGVPNAGDNCPAIDNGPQEDGDRDGIGDACDFDPAVADGDLDGDGILDPFDNCPVLDNEGQENWDEDVLGDACDEDDDNDGVFDTVDNCHFVANSEQENADGDLEGDACDTTDNRECPEFVSAHECSGDWVLCEPESLATVPVSRVIRGWSSTVGGALYWYAMDGECYVFPNETTFRSWFPTTGECPVIRQVSNTDLASLMLGGNVSIRPGTYLTKITTDPMVYGVSRGGVLRRFADEATVAAVYGANWRLSVVDVPDIFFGTYRIGAPITAASDYDRFAEYISVPTIDHDLGLR